MGWPREAGARFFEENESLSPVSSPEMPLPGGRGEGPGGATVGRPLPPRRPPCTAWEPRGIARLHCEQASLPTGSPDVLVSWWSVKPGPGR